MKSSFSSVLHRLLFLCLLAWGPGAAAVPILPGASYPGTNEDFSEVTKAVVELVQGRDPAKFARAMTPSFEDWKALRVTNAETPDPDALKGMDREAENQRAEVERSAAELLAKADALHLDFSKAALQPKTVPPEYLGFEHYPNFQAADDRMPMAEKLEISFSMKGGLAGEFKLVMHDLIKFPAGWRCGSGIQWESFPEGVGDAGTRRDMVLKDKAAAYEGITDADDPALLKLAGAMRRFIHTADTNVFLKQITVTHDMGWNQLQLQHREGPTRAEFDAILTERDRDLLAAAREVLRLIDDAGVNLKDADIQVEGASLKRLTQRGMFGGPFGGEGFKVTLKVKSNGQSKTGKSPSGEYVLAVDNIERFGDEWRAIGNLRLDQFPPGVVDEKTAANLALENYVAEFRKLPDGTAAPDVEFTRLDNSKKMKLSDLRGKVVVLDFWATWCPPCQEPLARLQIIRKDHPDWKDQVAVVPLSIDDTMSILRNHLEERRWTNTFNVWAGEGGWKSSAAKIFRVTGVPTTYIIDQRGKIATAGHPGAMNIGNEVDSLLRTGRD